MRTTQRASRLAAVFVTLLAGAAPPEIVRLRVPSGSVSKWIPDGTPTKGMSAERFELLARDALAAAATGEPSPRLLRTIHRARWEDGVLVGRSELVIEPPRADPGSLVLEPWTPAIDPSAEAPARVHTDDSGRVFLRLAPSPRAVEMVTVVVPWQLRGRPGSKGRKFSLGLPGTGATELKLDLPEGLEPEGPTGLRRGPTSPADGRALWVYVGPTGSDDLLLIDNDGKADPSGAQGLWVEGPTRVNVDEASATWSLDWSVSGGERASRQLIVSLDPGLDLVAVYGPGVDGFRAEPAADGSTRVSVRLRGSAGAGKAATPVSIRALARVPSEGRWVVPAARPVGAVWTGGTTALRIDPSRVVEAVHPLAGRLSASTADEPSEDHRLDFTAERAGPVAELTFRKPRADVSAEVRGSLQVGSTSPRLTCRVTWT
ncbi:MAG: hypothetical protein LC745_10855, partial [Planctomycetia bacterium]|nr:hypothetical protein [Planctomycetia bacterium]